MVGGMSLSVAAHVGLMALALNVERPAPAVEERPATAAMEVISWHTPPEPPPAPMPPAEIEAPRPEREAPREPAVATTHEPTAVPEDLGPAIAPVMPLAGVDPVPQADATQLHLASMPESVRRPQEVRADGGWPMILNPMELQRYLRNRYNPVLHRSGSRGLVEVAVAIDPRGEVRSSAIRKSSGDPRLDEIALTLLGQIAQFRPPHGGGPASLLTLLITVPFDSFW